MYKLDELHCATEPTRKEILFLLPSYANEIGKKLKISPRLVSFHLEKLEQYGLADSNYTMANGKGTRPVVIRHFILTQKGKEIKKTLTSWEQNEKP